MEKGVYEVEAKIESNHWWFIGRRWLFKKKIQEFEFSKGIEILDIGSSTGTNLRMLNDMGFVNFQGVDVQEEAIRWCRKKGFRNVKYGNVCALPFKDCRFDVVLATDILEHVDDDQKALCEIHRVLKPTGIAIITVPAFKSLWGLQDDVSNHKRRYNLPELTRKINETGFDSLNLHYFNFILFLPILLARQLIRFFSIKLRSENEINSFVINFLLKLIFIFDIIISTKLHLPFGVSLFALLQKRINDYSEV